MKVRYAYVLLATVLFAMAAQPAVAQDQQGTSFVSTVDVSGKAVTMTPEGTFVGFVMQVAGPEDFYLEQSFKGDEVPSLGLTTKYGALADGSYSIQVYAQPLITDEVRAALTEARDQGDRAAIYRTLKEAGINQHAMVFRMNVGVAGGQFLATTEEEPAPASDGEEMGQVDGLGIFTPVLLSDVLPDFADPGSGPVPTAPLAAPDVTRAALGQALQPVDDEDTLPAFIARLSGPNTEWSQAHFQNVMPDGSTALLEGWLHPVGSNGPDQVFHAFFRQAAQDGSGYGNWIQGYFKGSEGSYSLLPPDQVTHADADEPAQAQLFDYLAEEPGEATAAAPRRDHVINDDCIIIGSMCVGFDCVNGMAFGFDTIVMQENNTRLFFNDTSSTASFPTTNWRLIANDSSNGGASYLAIEDADAGRRVFEVRAGAAANSLFVSSSSRIGLKTNAPAVEIHSADGDTPTLRLEQNGTSGFTPQTWDLASNETNFFIRDVTNGSRLPFRIRPNAPTSSIDIEGTTGDVGFGTSSPTAPIHVRRTDATAKILVEEASSTTAERTLIQATNNGKTTINLSRTDLTGDAAQDWSFKHGGTNFEISKAASGFTELLLTSAAAVSGPGNLTIRGNYVAQGSITLNAPDYVFDEDYDLMSLSDLETYIMREKHLPSVATAEEIRENGLDMTTMQMRLLEKVEELTLYTIQQQKTIEALQARLHVLEARQDAAQR